MRIWVLSLVSLFSAQLGFSQECPYRHGDISELEESWLGGSFEENLAQGFLREMSVSPQDVQDLSHFVGKLQFCFKHPSGQAPTILDGDGDPVTLQNPVIGRCTGTLIEGSRIITAAHCLLPSRAYRQANYYLASARITFDFDEADDTDDEVQTYELDIDPLKIDTLVDVMILEAVGPPDQNWLNTIRTVETETFGSIGAFPFRIGRPVQANEPLRILSHPRGRHLVLSDGGCFVFNRLAKVQADMPNIIPHRCATRGGSSGALLLNAANEVVGMHIRGWRPDASVDEQYNQARVVAEVVDALELEFGDLPMTDEQCTQLYVSFKLSSNLAGLEGVLGACEDYAIGALIAEEIALLRVPEVSGPEALTLSDCLDQFDDARSSRNEAGMRSVISECSAHSSVVGQARDQLAAWAEEDRGPSASDLRIEAFYDAFEMSRASGHRDAGDLQSVVEACDALERGDFAAGRIDAAEDCGDKLVRWAQAELTRLECDPNGIDGAYGSGFRSALGRAAASEERGGLQRGSLSSRSYNAALRFMQSPPAGGTFNDAWGTSDADALRDASVMLSSFRRGALCVGPRHMEVIEDRLAGSFVYLEGGTFLMGSPSNAVIRGLDEGTVAGSRGGQLEVIVEPFFMGQFEVTFDDWEECVSGGGCQSNRNPDDRGWGRGRRPVINVSWEDAQEYVSWLNSQVSGSNPYGLPSEAQWEYAARAGTMTAYSTGSSISSRQANFGGNENGTVEEERYAANEFNLYNMHGNVWEWVEDCYIDHLSVLIRNGRAYTASRCDHRVLRGGSWVDESRNLRSANRSRRSPTDRSFIIGFRITKTP